MTLAALMRAVGAEVEPPTLEEVLCDPDWFGLTTASPLQRAVCRWAEGLPVDHERLAAELKQLSEGYAPDIAERMQLSWCLGGPDVRVAERPELVVLVAGIRTGKSMLDAAGAVWMTLTVPVPEGVMRHERIRHSTVSVDKDKAKAVLDHLRGLCEQPQLKRKVERDVTDGLDLEHNGHTYELRVVHGGTAGKGLVAYWHVGAVFDEAPRMLGEDDAKVNLDDQMDAVEHRVFPGGQVWWTGSPWAPMGPVYDVVQQWHGRPGRVLVVRAPGPALNPVKWSPAECEKARERKRRGVEDQKKGSFDMDVLGEWGSPESVMFDLSELTAVLRAGELDPVEGETYVAAMDPSGRGGNAWTLVIGGQRLGDGKPRLMVARQWFPSAEHTETAILEEMKPLLERYGVRFVYTDQFASGVIQELARAVGIYMSEFRVKPWTSKNKLDAFDGLRTLIREQRVELVDAPNLREDLLRVKRKLTPQGASVTFPETGDGRHCDYAPAIAMWASSPMTTGTKPLTKAERIAAQHQADEDEEFRTAPKGGRFAPRGRMLR